MNLATSLPDILEQAASENPVSEIVDLALETLEALSQDTDKEVREAVSSRLGSTLLWLFQVHPPCFF